MVDSDTRSRPATPGAGAGTVSAGAAPARRGVLAAVRQALPQSYLLLVLLGIIVAGFIATPDFLTARNATNVVTFSAIVAVLAVGQFFVVLTGGIDLSVGAVIGCFIISIITNIMNLIGISSEPQLVIKGLVIVVAVFLSSAGGVTRISAALASMRGRSGRTAGG